MERRRFPVSAESRTTGACLLAVALSLCCSVPFLRTVAELLSSALNIA